MKWRYCSLALSLRCNNVWWWSDEETNQQRSCVSWCFAWRRHQMETISALLVLFAGNSPVTGEFSTQRPVTGNFDVFLIYWKQKVVNLTILSSLMASHVFVITTYCATTDDKVVKFTIFCFQWHRAYDLSMLFTWASVVEPVISEHSCFSTRRVKSTSTHWGRHKIDAISQTIFSDCIFLNENARISLKISLKCAPKVRINNIPALVQIMAWRRPGDKPLSEPMMDSLLTHICVTRPQWVNVS